MAKTKLQIIEESFQSILKNKPVQEPQETVVEEVEVDIPQEQKTKNGGEDKKLLKGAGYVGEKLGLGLLRSVEGIADFAVGGLADLFGGDEFAENLMKNDWVNYSHADEWYDPGKGMSFVGDAASGIGGMLPTIAVSFIPGVGAALATGTLATGAAGQATSDSVKETGELGGKEWLYGAASGALEAGVEALTGGIAGTAPGKVLTKNLGKTALGKTALTFAGEGVEEVLSDVINPLLRRTTGLDGTLKDAYKDVTTESLLRTFAVGGTIGAVMGGGRQLIGAARSGGFNNYTAGQTAEQLTERQAYANLRQAKGKGTVYTAKDINKTAQSLSNRLQKMTSAERETFMVRNANIAPLFNADGTLVEANTVANLDTSVKTEANTPTSSGQNNQNAVVSDGSYNRNAYSASLRGRESTFKYKPISTTSAVSNTARTVMNTLTKLSKGKSNIVLTDEAITTESGEKANALYKDGIIYLDANATDYQKALAVGVHEVIHGIEGTKEYNKLADFVAEVISNNPELQKRYNVEAYRDIYDAILEGDYSEITKNYQATTEMFADFLGNEVANNEGTLNRLLLKDRNIIVRLWEWVKDAISKLGMTKGEREARKGLEKLEKLLSNALEAGRGGRSLEDVEKTARAAEKAHLEDELKKKKAAQAEETEGAVAENATPALARAKINVDNKGKTSYNKKRSYYSQFNTLATSWASKAEKGELFAGYDGNSYRIVIATGDDYLYENYKTVDANNDALIEYYEEFIKENNEKIRSHRNANSVFESIEEFDAVKGRNNRYSLDVARRQPNDRDGGIYQEQSQRNGERNTEEGSGNQRGLKGGRASLNTIDVYSAKQIDTVIDDITDMFIEMSGIDTNVYNVDIRGKKALAKQFADLLNSKAAFSTKSASERANGLVDKILGNVRITNADASGVAEAENTVEFMRKYFHSMNLASVKSDINNESNYRLFSGGKEAMAWDSVLQEIVESHPEYEQGSDIETLLHVMDEYNRAKKLIAEQTVQLSKVVKDLDFVKTMMTQQLTTSLERDKTTYKKVGLNDESTNKGSKGKQWDVRKETTNSTENLSAEELAKKTSDRVQTIVKDKGVIRQTISDIREGKKSVKETWDEILEELKYGERARWIEVQIALTDKQAGIAKAAHNLGININGEIQRARAAKAAAVNMLTYKQTDFAGNVIGESLRDIFDPIQKKGEQYATNFNEYLLHQLNIDRMSVVDNAKAEIEKLYKANPNLKTVVEEKYETEAKWRKAVTDEQGGEEYLRLANSENKPVFQQEVTAEFSKERLAELDKQHPTFKGTAEKVWQYNKNLLQYRVDAGLITQAQADQMNKMYPHYVPAFYDTTNAARTGVSGGKNRVAVRTGIKSAKGSGGKADIIDVSLAISRQTESVVRAATINKVVAKLYDKAVETNTFIDLDIAGREKLTDPNVDYDEKIAKDNQVVFYKDGEKITLDVSEYMYAGFEGLGLYKKELNNPLENATAKGIDIFKKLVTSWNPLFAVSNAAKDFGDALFHTRYNVFKYMGRYVQSAFRVTSKNSEYRKLWDAYRAMGGFQAGFYKGEIGAYDKRSELRRGIAKFTKALDALNDYIEQIPRFAEFVASVKAGNSYEKALYDAADVTTNFSRGGDLVKKLNRSWVPFLNPAVQGWSKMYRTWVDPMDRLSEKQINSLSKSTKGRMMLSVYGQLVMRALVLGIGAGLLNDLVFRWIDEDEDYAKLPLNVKENYYLIKTGDKFIKIPKSRVTSLWGMIGTRIVEYTNGNEDALNPWDWFTTAWGMVSPVDAASRHIASPIFDVIANRTWYGSEIESRAMEQMYEAKDRYDESTSSIAIAIGQALKVSPKKVHYVLDQYSGVLGDIILPMTTNKAEQDMISARFVVDPLYTNNISNEYYDLREELNYAKSAKDLSAMMALKYLNKCDEELSEIYQLKRDVANYNDLSVEEKKLLISTLRDKGLVDISGKETITDKEKREITDILQALLNGSLSLLTENVKTFEQIVIDEKFAENFSNLIYSDMYNEFDEKKKDSAYNKAMNYYYELYMAKMTDTKLKPKYALYGAIGANETSLYLTEIAKIESDKDRKGNTIAGSRKKKVQRYIQGLKLSAQQKNILLYLAGYKPTEMGQAVVRSYLLKQGYRAKEINDLWNN